MFPGVGIDLRVETGLPIVFSPVLPVDHESIDACRFRGRGDRSAVGEQEELKWCWHLDPSRNPHPPRTHHGGQGGEE